jgi:hypothetical protein
MMLCFFLYICGFGNDLMFGHFVVDCVRVCVAAGEVPLQECQI